MYSIDNFKTCICIFLDKFGQESNAFTTTSLSHVIDLAEMYQVKKTNIEQCIARHDQTLSILTADQRAALAILIQDIVNETNTTVESRNVENVQLLNESTYLKNYINQQNSNTEKMVYLSKFHNLFHSFIFFLC